MSLLSPTAKSNLYTMGISSRNDPRQTVPQYPCIPIEEVRRLRARLIMEEALETCDALGIEVCLKGVGECLDMHDLDFVPSGSPDLEQIIDGCCDVQYVTVGTLVACGVPDVPHMDEVNRANNAKFPNGVAITDANGKYQKPPGWHPPNHVAAANEYAGGGFDLHAKSERIIADRIVTEVFGAEEELPDDYKEVWSAEDVEGNKIVMEFNKENTVVVDMPPPLVNPVSSPMSTNSGTRTCPGCGVRLDTMAVCPACAAKGHRWGTDAAQPAADVEP